MPDYVYEETEEFVLGGVAPDPDEVPSMDESRSSEIPSAAYARSREGKISAAAPHSANRLSVLDS